MEFRCIEECSQCCIEREYYPTKQFGKIGVLILPEENPTIIFFILGIMGEYVGRIYLNSKDKPLFVVEKTSNSNET